jgi:dolichyl-phosphate-mannose-protein mannosyltransferase
VPAVPIESSGIPSESSVFAGYSARTIVVIALLLFIAAHLALMIGLTTPDKITFDEVHYVPAFFGVGLNVVLPAPACEQ